uniref:glutathione transferase n=2 Tax=Cajanus cajan TaxID=3821 RepID=A0A151R1D9_CAJCA|nr:putative glutathione S-transferase [Cajanus cajan]
MMGSEKVKLVSSVLSPVGRRVEWVLKLKGVDYEYVEEDLFNKSNLLLELNPVHKKVPVLVHHHKPIAESLIILQYIDQTWNQYPLLPQHPYQRALARFWGTLADKLAKTSWDAMCGSGDEQEKTVKEAREVMDKLEEEIKGKRFFGGDRIGYIDIAFGWIPCWLPVWEEVGSMQIVEPLKHTAISAWINNFLSHPVISHNLPPRDKLLLYSQRRKKDFSSTLRP